MSCLSDLSLAESNVYSDKPMYVFPTKTRLNSIPYLVSQDTFRNPSVDRYDTFDNVNRKICNNTDIPTYPGFSVANAPIKHRTKLNDMKDKNKRNVNSVPRKTTAQFNGERKEGLFDSLKKLKVKRSVVFNENVNNEPKKPEESKKGTDSFWMMNDKPKVGHHNHKSSDPVKKMPHDVKPYNQSEIKEYMKKKRIESKCNDEEKLLLEKKRNELIKENLQRLSESRRNPSKSSSRTPIPIRMNVNASNVYSSGLDNCDGDRNNISDRCSTKSSRTESLDLQLGSPFSSWKPLKCDELEALKNEKRQEMQEEMKANEHIMNILNSLNEITKKINLKKPKISEKPKNETYDDDNYDDDDDYSVSFTSDFSHNNISLNSEKIKTRKTAWSAKPQFITPKILGNRARRKLSSDIENEEQISEMIYDSSEYEEYVEGLINENKKRYDKSSKERIFLLNNNHKMKPTVKVKPFFQENSANGDIHDLNNDPLRFMKTYLQNKEKRSFDLVQLPSYSSTWNKTTDVSKNLNSTENLVSQKSITDDEDIIELKLAIKSKSSSHSVSGIQDDSDKETNVCHTKSETEMSLDTNADDTNEDIKPTPASISKESRKKHVPEFRWSPSSLEHQFIAALNYQEGVQTGYEQLLETERLQGVSLAQQETVSLAQLLKARDWQYKQETEQTSRIDRFTRALEAFTKIHTPSKRKRHSPSDNSVSSSKDLTTSTKSSVSLDKDTVATTESDATEIAEEIEDFDEHGSVEKYKPKQITKASKRGKKSHESDISEISEDINFDRNETESEKPSEEIHTEKECPTKSVSSKVPQTASEIHTVNNSNIMSALSTNRSPTRYDKEIPTARSFTNADDSSAVMSDKSASKSSASKDVSTAESFECETKSSNESEKEIHTEISHDESVINVNQSEDKSITSKSFEHDAESRDSSLSAKEISTARSLDDSVKQKSSSSVKSIESKLSTQTISSSDRSTPQKQPSENDYSSSVSKESLSTSKTQDVEYSQNTFESISKKSTKGDHNTSEISDMERRILALKKEKDKKVNLVKRLSKKVKMERYQRKEVALKEQINLLNSHIQTLQTELDRIVDENSHSVSSISSCLVKPELHKEQTSKNKHLPKVKIPEIDSKKSSSSSTLSKEDDIKTEFSEYKNETFLSSNSSITKTSGTKDEHHPKVKVDDVDTPRSVKQLHFGEINEEYSASDRESSEAGVPSEKHQLSKDITDNSAGKSKSDKFHVLNLSEKKDDEFIDDNEAGFYSSRTLHSDISELPDEINDISDDGDDNTNGKLNIVTDKESSFQELYSDDFSDQSSHRPRSVPNVETSEHGEPSVHDEKFSYEPSSESSQSTHPSVPPRRKEKSVSDGLTDKLEPAKTVLIDDTNLLNEICDYVYIKLISDISDSIKPTILNKPVEVDLSEDSLESLISRSGEIDYQFFKNFVTLNDSNVVTLSDVAVEQLFNARNAKGHKTTDEVFDECAKNLPKEFAKVNGNDDCKEICNNMKAILKHNRDQWKASDRLTCPYVNRIFIYQLVLDILKNLYELDDETVFPWEQDAYRIRKNKKVKLWKGNSPPQSLELVKAIVQEQLGERGFLSSIKVPSSKRTRLHTWCMKQHKDPIDRLLIDETMKEDDEWNDYHKAEEIFKFQISDTILEKIISDECQYVLSGP